MVDWALVDLGLPEVLGITVADNVGSHRALKRAGFARIREEVRGGRTLVVYRAAPDVGE